MADDPTESWRSVVGYEGRYSISSLGRLRSDRSGHILAGGHNGRGYRNAALCKNGIQRSVMYHSMVAAAFLGPRPPGCNINHKNGQKEDNRLSNLEYITPKENSRHAVRVGLIKTGVDSPAWNNPRCVHRGQEHGLAKLTDDKVLTMRRLSSEGISAVKIAQMFSVSATTVRNIVRRETWTHIT